MNTDALTDLLIDATGDPDLQRLYIARTSAGLPYHREFTRGWWTHSLDLQLKPWLQSVGLWRGRGVAFAIDDVAITVDAAGDPDAAADRILAVAAHELGHEYQQPRESMLIERPGTVDKAESLLVAACAAPATTSTERPPWRHHTAPWLRASIHLAYRLGARGHHVPLSVVMPAGMYDLSSIYAYESTLGDEPEQLANLPLYDLDTVRPPQSFLDLWRSDVRRWVKENQAIALSAACVPDLVAAIHNYFPSEQIA